MLAKNPERAILFLNLGGPETLSEVKPFLIRLFEDPEVIRIPFTPLRKLVAWLIATTREKKSQALYQTIGGGSPIRRLTDLQSKEVEKELKSLGRDVAVRTAFTCSHPLVEDVIGELFSSGVSKFLAFPLYPQYSFTTTKGSLDRVRQSIEKLSPKPKLVEISSWPTHPLFLKAHAEQIQSVAAEFSDPKSENIHLLFSAHSIPEKLVSQEGDPYKKEMEETVRGVLTELRWNGPWTLAWQSKLGPVKWLEPFTDQIIKDLGTKGTSQVLVVPIAFVTDHIETLNEIDIQFAGVAKAFGIREFRRTPGLNNHPTFIRALVDLAQKKDNFWS